MERDSLVYKLRRKAQVLAHRIIPNKTLSTFYSRIVLKKKVDLSNPKTFNEKIQWCMLNYYPENPLVVKCADKFAVRDYVASKGLAEKLVPLLGAWKSADDINWDILPEKFVLKCNHGCA